MFHSLRFRLLLTVGLVVAVAIAVVGIISSRVTMVAFDRFLELQATPDQSQDLLASARDSLEDYYESEAGWQGVEARLHAFARTPEGPHLLVLFGANEGLVAMSEVAVESLQVERLAKGELQVTWEEHRHDGVQVGKLVLAGPQVQLRSAAGQPAGSLYLIPQQHFRGGEEPSEQFVRGVNRGHLLLVVVAGLIALAATFFISQRFLQPVEQLTVAARGMSGGDLSRRVSVDRKDEVGELAHAFNSMADGLSHIEELRRNMVSDIAHELRTPLTNIRCQLEALQDELAMPTPEVIASLHEETMLLTRLVADLQDLALAESGQLRMYPESVDLAEEIQKAVRPLVSAAHEPGPQIDFDLAELPPAWVDPKRFRQIIRNLVRNACTATPADGRIRISVAENGARRIEVVVCDTGSGIEPAQLAKVFERFYRVDRSRDRATGGAGLGLAIVKQLVEAQGGEIRAASTPGRGTTFTFTVPCAT